MTPKEKAQELVKKFRYPAVIVKVDGLGSSLPTAKQCAIIAVNEIIKTHKHKTEIALGGYSSEIALEFWNEVKTEIENQ